MNQIINLKTQKDLILKKSKISGAGKGVFAARDFKKDEFLGVYLGNILSEKQFNNTKDTSYVWEVSVNGRHFYIDAKHVKSNNKLRFVNGAMSESQQQKVNVESYQYGGMIRYRTIKSVKEGTEFVIEYGDEYW
jgi:SET domain-containing protein